LRIKKNISTTTAFSSLVCKRKIFYLPILFWLWPVFPLLFVLWLMYCLHAITIKTLTFREWI